MSKPRSRVADYLVYLLVRVVICFVQMLSYPAARNVSKQLAWLLYHLDRRHRLVALDNLKQALPDLRDEPDQVVRAVYRHFCLLLVEIVLVPRKLHPSNWRQHLELAGGRQLVDALLSDRPLLLVTGHFGNWELGGYVLGLLGFNTYAIARTLDNPYLDAFLRSFRERTGQKVLAKQDDFDNIQAVLAHNGVLATLADQDAGARGPFVNFFGRPASTHKAVALLALEYNVPMIVIGTPRVGEPMKYTVVAEDVIRPKEFAGDRNAVVNITQRFTTALERLVRGFPEQYFWLHRRWKHQPQPRKAKRAA
jgi:Kdo2-lipid IVA lauroyltransferase/acyltransferase